MEEYNNEYLFKDEILVAIFSKAKSLEQLTTIIRDKLKPSFIASLKIERLIVELKDKGLLNTESNGEIIIITPLGRELVRNGGFKKNIEDNNEVEYKRLEKERIEDEKRKYDLLNAKRIYKTYWFTFWVAIIGAAVTLVLAILKVLGK